VWDVVDRGSGEVMDRSITGEVRSMVSVDALLDGHEVGVRARVEELRVRVARVVAARVWSRVRIDRTEPLRAANLMRIYSRFYFR
jgi:hypothetical protein